ncbi:hypothetical protein [Methylobacterium frigidaeris]|uniref:hypothetical protein n=1 Tax=Methylobacterium frigidaeris TaxID=2038277 RepID=UPI001EE010B3|nr:hypothetical protein [Methylobacterium frigidaeris]
MSAFSVMRHGSTKLGTLLPILSSDAPSDRPETGVDLATGASKTHPVRWRLNPRDETLQAESHDASLSSTRMARMLLERLVHRAHQVEMPSRATHA